MMDEIDVQAMIPTPRRRLKRGITSSSSSSRHLFCGSQVVSRWWRHGHGSPAHGIMLLLRLSSPHLQRPLSGNIPPTLGHHLQTHLIAIATTAIMLLPCPATAIPLHGRLRPALTWTTPLLLDGNNNNLPTPPIASIGPWNTKVDISTALPVAAVCVVWLGYRSVLILRQVRNNKHKLTLSLGWHCVGEPDLVKQEAVEKSFFTMLPCEWAGDGIQAYLTKHSSTMILPSTGDPEKRKARETGNKSDHQEVDNKVLRIRLQPVLNINFEGMSWRCRQPPT